MLDFKKLLPQFDNITADALLEETADKIALSAEAFAEAAENWERFEQKLLDSESQTFWSQAHPLEKLDTAIPLNPGRYPCTVVAIDGSQIMPSHHEVHSCYLINIGRAVITYGSPQLVVLDSSPHLFHGPEDIYPLVDRRRMHVDDLFVGLERYLLELSALRDTAIEAQNRALPIVAFLDGSLITWSLDRMHEAYRRKYSQRLHLLLDSFARNRIPIFGYISQSRSTDIINCLRVWKCPYVQSDCHRLCGELSEDDYPCSVLWPTTDRQLMQYTLPPFHRGPIFVSGSGRGVSSSGDQAICFTFVNVGKEVARVEFPRWLCTDIPLLHRSLEIAIAQAEKGPGYPIALAEAHNQAVVRSADRKRFFELLADHLIELGVPRVRVSPKESGKRRGIV